MAIIVYTGVMGSGKTYEAVSTAALTALRAGRRVVTNISGFNFERIRDHLGEFKDGSHLEPDRVVVIPSKRITEDHFFFDPDLEHDSLVKPGDLVLIDEVWAFWGKDSKLSPEHQKFFRMHRHYTEAATGVSCDLVVMIQDLASLHRFIRGVIESNFKFTKMKTLGLSSRYRVEVYEGNSQRKASLVSASVKKYDKAIFPLYKSYDAGIGKESVVDDRQNLFKNKWFVLIMIGSLVGVISAGTWFFKFVYRMRNPDSQAEHAASTSKSPPGAKPAAAGASASAAPVAALPARSAAVLVAVWSSPKGGGRALIRTADGRQVFVPVTSGVLDGWSSQVEFEGAMVSFGLGQAGAVAGGAK